MCDMVKQITSIEKPKIKKSIKELLDLPQTITEEAEAKISIDSRGQFFVRFPSIISEMAQITTKDEIKFRIVSKIPIKKDEIKLGIELVRG